MGMWACILVYPSLVFSAVSEHEISYIYLCLTFGFANASHQKSNLH